MAPVVKRLIDEKPDEKAWLPGFALIAADLGYQEPARRRLRELAESGFELPFDAKRSTSLSYVAEVAFILDESDAAERLYHLMSAYQHMTITSGMVTVCYGAASRYLGMLATTLGGIYVVHVQPRLKVIAKRYFKALYGDPARISPGTFEGYTAGTDAPGSFEHLSRILRSWHDDLEAINIRARNAFGIVTTPH